MRCQICGQEDLFSAVTQQPACALCVMRFGIRTPVTHEAVAAVRERLGLAAGEYRQSNPGAEAAAILGGRR